MNFDVFKTQVLFAAGPFAHGFDTPKDKNKSCLIQHKDTKTLRRKKNAEAVRWGDAKKK